MASSNYCVCVLFITFGACLIFFGNYAYATFDVVRFIKPDFSSSSTNHDDIWTWVCNGKSQCEQQEAVDGELSMSLETCNMLCSTPPLWPNPKHFSIAHKNYSTFNKYHIILKVHASEDIKPQLEVAANIFFKNIPSNNDQNIFKLQDNDKILKLNIYVNSSSLQNGVKTNVTYELNVQNNEIINVNLFAHTYFGVLHGLETLNQLIWFDTVSNRLQILHDVKIVDYPAFPHRGVLIDTARNYFTIPSLMKVVDGMAASKLNVLHLHLTDSQSFPVVLPSNPEFAQHGAYSSNMTYSADDIKDLVEYADVRGIRVVMEIDAPSHVNRGWPKELVMCGEKDVTNGHLNIDNPDALDVLETIYADLLDLGSNRETFHIGGDEVNLQCWRNSKAAKATPDLYKLWLDYANRMLERVKSANNDTLPENLVLWSSPLTDRQLTKLNYKEHITVQFWLGSFKQILTNGYKIIFSTVGNWYLDCGYGPWKPSMKNGVCDPYTPWQKFYKYRPWQDYSDRRSQVLGGEVCLWSEQVSEDDLETRLWPRAAAFAERVWSDIESFDEHDVYRRLVSHSERLKARGLRTAAMWPRWCSQNPGKC